MCVCAYVSKVASRTQFVLCTNIYHVIYCLCICSLCCSMQCNAQIRGEEENDYGGQQLWLCTVLPVPGRMTCLCWKHTAHIAISRLIFAALSFDDPHWQSPNTPSWPAHHLTKDTMKGNLQQWADSAYLHYNTMHNWVNSSLSSAQRIILILLDNIASIFLVNQFEAI